MATHFHPGRPPLAGRFVRAVYLSTPLFVVLDYVYGVSLRIPFLDALPGAKAVYYMAAIGCAIAVVTRPSWTSVVGLAESMVNISLLILSTGAAYLGMLESAASPDVVIVNPFTAESITSLILSATVAGASYLSSHGVRAAV